MFDLDEFERYWKENSFSLSEEEILKIFISEGATLDKYYKEIDEYRKNIKVDVSAEELMLMILCGNSEKYYSEQEERLKKYKYPKKTHLSKEAQQRIIEGCMDQVFDATRYWYEFFDKKISLEKLYYICLEALIKCVKYALHCGKEVFKLYIRESIKIAIINYVAKTSNITYREAYEYINDKEKLTQKIVFDKKIEESLESPATIKYMRRDDGYVEDYMKDISYKEFFKVYNEALSKLTDIEKEVMKLSYDMYGDIGLTYKEMSEYFGIDTRKVLNIKRNAKRKLRNNYKLKEYKSGCYGR